MINKNKYDILCNIRHFPLIITKIFNYSLKRPFILHQLIDQSKCLKEKLTNFKIERYNDLSKEVNNLYLFSKEILNFQRQYEKIMTKTIKIEEEEKNYYISKPYINSLFDCSDKLFSLYKNFSFNKNKDININNLFAQSFFEFCSKQKSILLSINLFSKENNYNLLNLELTDADLDYNYIKYLNQKKDLNIINKQKMKMCINIYNKYSKIKLKNFLENKYYNNIDLIKNLNIEEIYFIRPNIKEAEKIENILYKKEIIDEINIMFVFIKEIKNKSNLISIFFSDNIIYNINRYYNDIKLINLFDNNNKFENLKNIGISPNILNKNIKNIIYSLFNFNLSIIYYQDIIDYINNNNNNLNSFNEENFYINLESHIIYDINIYKYLSNIFNIKNNVICENISKIEIIYNCEDINIFLKSDYNINNNFINNCYLPNIKEIIIKNNSNKVYKQNIINKINKDNIFNFIKFICSFSKKLSSIIIQDGYIPFNIFDYKDININNITDLNIKSPYLNNYRYNEIIEKINKFNKIQIISIDTFSSNFNGSFGDVKISKNLKDLKKFTFNDFFEYKNIEKNKIVFKQDNYIDIDLFDIFSEIVENEKNLEIIELNGFHYNLDNISNPNIKNLKINLEEDDKYYKINQTQSKNINLKLNNFPNLNSLYIYVDILEKIDNFIQFPINPNLKRIYLFSSFINCDINILDNLLKQNGVELIVRIIESYNKAMIMAYIASFPNIQ